MSPLQELRLERAQLLPERRQQGVPHPAGELGPPRARRHRRLRAEGDQQLDVVELPVGRLGMCAVPATLTASPPGSDVGPVNLRVMAKE